MKKWLFSLMLIPSLSFSEGPILKHPDPTDQNEIVNLYQDIANSSMLVQHVNGNSITNFTTTSGSFITTGSSVTIVMKNDNDVVHVSASGILRNGNMTNTGAYVTIFRDSTNICGGGSAVCGQLQDNSLTGNMAVPSSPAIDDSPGSGSHVYSVRIMSSDGVTTVGWGNIGSCQIFADEYRPQP